MDFNQISRTYQQVRAKRWTVCRGPIYRARGVGRGLTHAVHCPIRSGPTDRVRINLLISIIALHRH
jgi:hypothetical protein